MTEGWLFGIRKCRIIERIDNDQVKIQLENGCSFVIYQALIYEEKHEKNYLPRVRLNQ